MRVISAEPLQLCNVSQQVHQTQYRPRQLHVLLIPLLISLSTAHIRYTYYIDIQYHHHHHQQSSDTMRESGTCYHRQSNDCHHCRLSSLHWRQNCFTDRTTTPTSSNSSIDTSLIRDIYCGPEVLFETCVSMKFVNDDDDDECSSLQYNTNTR